MIGATLGHYRILDKLDEGGMGVVYRARDLSLGRDVAIKMLPEGRDDDDEARRLLRREARNLSRVNHPNVETLYELGTHEGLDFLVTELVTGRTLERRIREGPVPEPELLGYAAQIATALAAIHEHGIVHRDLKPSNVMITDRGQVKVVDFGVARLLPGLASSLGSTSGELGAIAGTLAYMAPEILRGLPAEPASDLYSLGAVLYEMATGRLPHDAETSATLVFRILNEPITPVRALNRQLSPGTEAIILRCLEREPAARYPSATELAEHLDRAAAGATGRPPARTGTTAAAEPVTVSRPSVARPLGVLVLVAVVSGLVLFTPGLERFFRPRPRLAPARVVVVPFENNTGDPSLDAVGRMASDWISQGLTRTGLVEVVQPGTVLQVADGTAMAGGRFVKRTGDVRLGEETGAATVVSGTYVRQRDSLVFQARFVETATRRVIDALEPEGAPVGTPLVAIEALRRRVTAGLATRLNPALAKWANTVSRPPSYEAYQEYVDGLDAFVHRRWPHALRHYERAAAMDTSYYFARISVGFVYLNLDRSAPVDSVVRSLRPVEARLSAVERLVLDWLEAWVVGDAEEALRVARAMAALAPASMWDYQHALSASLANRPAEAVTALDKIDPERGVYRGWSPYWETLTAAEHMLADYQREMRDARRGRRQYPELSSILCGEIRAKAVRGKTRAVEELVDRSRQLPGEPGWSPGVVMLFAARELRAHGQGEAAHRIAERAVAWYQARLDESGAYLADSSGLAAALYQSERWAQARTAYEGLAATRPEDVNTHGYLGAIAARAGNREAALAQIAALQGAGGVGLRGVNTYWCADIAALLGDHERALTFLREAREQGHAIHFKMHADPDLESLRSDPRFRELLQPKD